MNIHVLSPSEIVIDGAAPASLAAVLKAHPGAAAAVEAQLTRFFLSLRSAVATEQARAADATARAAAAEGECAELRAFAGSIIARAKALHAGLTAIAAEAGAGLAALAPADAEEGATLSPESIAAALAGAGKLIARAQEQLSAIATVIAQAETPAQQRRLAEIEERLAELERERAALAGGTAP